VVFSKQDRKTPREMATDPGYGSRERSPGGHSAIACILVLVRATLPVCLEAALSGGLPNINSLDFQ
jgi:hypothetical protein